MEIRIFRISETPMGYEKCVWDLTSIVTFDLHTYHRKALDFSIAFFLFSIYLHVFCSINSSLPIAMLVEIFRPSKELLGTLSLKESKRIYQEYQIHKIRTFLHVSDHVEPRSLQKINTVISSHGFNVVIREHNSNLNRR